MSRHNNKESRITRNAPVLAAVLALCFTTASAQEAINGGGSSFAYPIYSKWFADYQKIDPSVQFNYQSIGSGAGIRQVIEGTLAFAGTDSPMTNQQTDLFRKKRGAEPLHLPIALGAIVPIYNMSQVSQRINFTGPVLAGIYLGKISKWNDRELVETNPGVALPDQEIVVIHRADGSGSTFVWLDFLAKVSPEAKEKIGVATSVKWPVGLGAKGNEGVTGLVKQTAGAIGYVELTYALQNNLPHGKLQNVSGKFVEASLESITAAASAAAAGMPADFRVSITNAQGESSYPVASFTWTIVPDRIENKRTRDSQVKFLLWALSSGQELLAPLHYARVPENVLAMERKVTEQIK